MLRVAEEYTPPPRYTNKAFILPSRTATSFSYVLSAAGGAIWINKLVDIICGVLYIIFVGVYLLTKFRPALWREKSHGWAFFAKALATCLVVAGLVLVGITGRGGGSAGASKKEIRTHLSRQRLFIVPIQRKNGHFQRVVPNNAPRGP